MSAPIGPGDWVECIDARPDSFGLAVPLTVNAIYLVAGVVSGVDAFGAVGDGIFIDGLRDEAFLDFIGGRAIVPAYDVARFRPIYRPKSEVIEALKAPPKRAPVRTVEPA